MLLPSGVHSTVALWGAGELEAFQLVLVAQSVLGQSCGVSMGFCVACTGILDLVDSSKEPPEG